MILFSEINTISAYSYIDGLFLRLSPSKAKQKIKNKIRENYFVSFKSVSPQSDLIRKSTNLPEDPFLFSPLLIRDQTHPGFPDYIKAQPGRQYSSSKILSSGYQRLLVLSRRFDILINSVHRRSITLFSFGFVS